jgi:hypothetical protein
LKELDRAAHLDPEHGAPREAALMFAGSTKRSAQAAAVAVLLAGSALPVRAQDQVVVLDVMYTATSANTMDSHYRVTQKAGTPTNWRSPVDYAAGKIHARVDVIAKPSNKKTLFNICFEGTPSYACMPYQPTPYTATGAFEWEPAFSSFYQYDMVDWSKPISKIALILKDENQNKPQGSPDFYPTTLHVTLTLVRAGATYKPPAVEPVDAGMAQDAGMPDAGEPEPEPDPMTRADSGTGSGGRPAAVDAGSGTPKPQSPPAAGTTGSGMAGMSGGSPAPTAPPAGAPTGTGQPMTSPPTGGSSAPAPKQWHPSTGSSSCAVSSRRGDAPGWWILLMLCACGLHSRARRHR